MNSELGSVANSNLGPRTWLLHMKGVNVHSRRQSLGLFKESAEGEGFKARCPPEFIRYKKD